jgi:predicted DNA-binding transcriptional regulator AlpA
MNSASTAVHYEIIDARELGRRWGVPETWVYERTRDRCDDPLPHVKLGRYVRFEWASPHLEKWWNRHRVSNRKNGGESKIGGENE